MTNLEDYENFKKNHQSRKVYDVQSLLSVGETMQFYQEQTMGDRALNVAKSVYNGAAGIARGTLRGLQAIRDTTELEMNRLNPDRMQMDEDFRAALDSAADAEMLKPYEVRADSGAEQFVYDLAQGAGQLTGQAAISLLPGGAVLSPAAMALQIGGEEYRSLREQGVDVETAGRAAAFNAAVQTPLESIGLSRIMRRLPANTLLWQRVRHTAENALTEGITEFLQEFPERASEIWALEHKGEPPKDAAEMAAEIAKTAFDHFGEIAPGAAYSGVIGWFLGGGASGLHIAADRALGGHIERAMQREAHNAMMEHANETANRIKESGVNPQYAAIVTNDNTQNATVYVDGMTLQGYAQEAGMEKVAESLGVTVEEIEKAAANGDTVDVKLGNFEATGAAFDGFFQAVQDDTAFEDGGYTPNKEKYEREILKQAKEQDDEFRAAQDELIGEIRRAGAKNEEAIHETAILSAWARNQENPLEALKSVPRYVFGGDGSAAGLAQAAMYRSREKSLSDFAKQSADIAEKKTEQTDKPFYRFTGSNGSTIDVSRSDMWDSYEKHQQTPEQFAAIEANSENFLAAYHVGNGNMGGQMVLAKISTPLGNAGVAYEFLPNGRVFMKTAFFDTDANIDNWMKKSGSSKSLLDESKPSNSTGNRAEELGAAMLSPETGAVSYSHGSSIDIIKEQLAKVNAEQQRYHQEVASQKEEVRKKYEGTDQWMKAPNGEPTNLTEDQWLTVRTEAFKNWFGDWENDPENASKVVDENGEPIVVYHGTNYEFEQFDTPLNMERIFLTESKDFAGKYGRIKMPLFVRAANVLNVDYKGKNAFDEIEVNGQEFGDIEELAEYAREQGFDGVRVKNVEDAGTASSVQSINDEVIVFNPTQIKSATDNNGQFDAGDPNIYHQLAGTVDNPGRNGDNSRGSDIVDERTAREIEREKPAVREQYEGTPGWMKAPNGKPTNLTEEQWLAARTKAFRREYGNWDYDGNTQLTATDIGTEAIEARDKKPVDMRNTGEVDRWVREMLQGSSVTIDKDGAVVNFRKRGLSAGVTKARDRGRGRDINNRRLYSKLKEIVQNSVYFDFREADEKHKSRMRGQDIYVSFLKAGENYYRVELVLDVNNNLDISYKGHQAYKIKIDPAVYHTQADKSTAYARSANAHTGSNFTISLDDLMEGVKPKEPKIPLDENGEPIFSDSPNTPDAERKPAPEREKTNTAQAQSRSDNQGGFSYGQTLKGEYNPETNIITLFKGADASTVIHETWHFFVEQMWRSVEDGSASAQTAKDFDTLLSYAGMTREAWAASDANGRRAAHEKLAEAGETYIMEGKAPSMELRGVFENFARWLKDVYRTISRSGNAAELTDEVREVFDRMLAAEDDIARMERVNGYFAKLPPVITEGMSDATKRRVEDFIEKARGKAVDILTRRALRNYTKEKRETVKNIRAKMKPQIEEEVGKRPVYACGFGKKDAKKYRRLTRIQESEHQIAQTAQALQEIVNGKEEASVPNLRPDLAEYGGSPDVTFVWGDQKKGLMHIGLRHGGEVIEHVIDTVLYGDVARFAETKKTVTLSHNGYEAILSLDEHGKKKTWLLTGWQKNTPDAAGEVSAQSGATQTAPTFSRRDLGAGLSDYITDLKKRKGRASLKDDEAAFLLEAELTAEQYGYSGADEMMKDVESAPPKSEAVSRRVREMTEELSDDGGMEGREEAIRESIYNEDEALLIAAEQWIIESYAAKARERQEAQEQRKAETKARRRERQEQQKAETAAEREARKAQEKQDFKASAEMAAALRQQARNVAKADLAKMNIFEATRTSRFVAAERRAAVRSAEYLSQEKYAHAAQQKNLQAYWHAMAAESINIKRRKEQYEKFIKTQTRLKKESWLNDTHFAAVSQLFARMGIAGQEHREAAEGARFKKLAEYAEKMSERFDCVDIADWILEEETDISDTKALTLDQYEDVVNAIKNIKAIVKAQKGVNMFSTGEAFAGMKQKILGLLKPLPVRFRPNPNKPTRPTAIEKWQASMENTDTLFEMMDDSSYGFFSKVWGNVIKRAADHEYECLEKYNKADADALKKWLPDKTAEAAAGEEVFYEELGTSVTKHTLVKMLINLGNADNAQRLCETVPVGFEKNSLWIFPDDEGSRYAAMEMTRQNLIHFLGRVLTKEDVEYAQRKIDAAEMFWGEKNDLEKRVKGFGLKKVQPTPVLLRINGENVILKGGYFPLMRNGETGSHSVAGEVRDDEELQGRRIRTYHTDTSATKKRTQARYPVNLFPGAETQWIYESIHDLCWREAMSDFRHVLNDQELFSMMKSRLGIARMNNFKELLEVCADPMNSKSYAEGERALGEAASWLRRRTSHAVIMCNLKVVMQNYANAFLYGNAVEGYTMADNLRALGRHMLAYHTPGTHREMAEFVTSKSAFMRERMALPDITVRDIVGENKEYAWEKVSREMGVRIMAFTDNATAMPNWIEAYNKKISEGATEQEAIDFADTIIRRVLGSSRITDVSSMQRGGPLMKLLTMFQSFFNARWNEFIRTERAASKQWAKGEKQEAFAMMFSYAVSKWLGSIMLSMALALQNPFGIDDEDDYPEILKEMKSYTGSMLGFYGQIGSFVVGKALNMHEYNYRISAVESTVDRAGRALDKVWSKNATTAEKAEGILDVAGTMYGVPAQFNRIFWNLYDAIFNGMDLEWGDIYRRRPKKERQ